MESYDAHQAYRIVDRSRPRGGRRADSRLPVRDLGVERSVLDAADRREPAAVPERDELRPAARRRRYDVVAGLAVREAELYHQRAFNRTPFLFIASPGSCNSRSLFSDLTEADLFCHRRSLSGIVRRNHRIVRGQVPFGPILFRRQTQLPKMTPH